MRLPGRDAAAAPPVSRPAGVASLRRKLVALMLLPVLALAALTVGLVLYWGEEVSHGQLLRRVTADLSVAHDIFGRVQRDYMQRLQSLAQSYVFSLALAEDDEQRLREQIETMRLTGGFDFLHLTDLNGRPLFEVTGERAFSPLHARAAQSGLPAIGIELMDAAQLDAEAPGLAERARLALLPTPRAAPTDREMEDRGMVMRSVVPVMDLNGTSVALLDGGVLVNRNFALVDAVRDLVYGPDTLAEGSIGTVTVFLDDVRISTNVPLRPGERALGTRVSQVVRDTVLGRGETWVARAFVVNDWYISAYEPIVDLYGTRVGMLYAGFLEAPYRRAYERALGISIAVLVLVCLLLVLSGWYGARRIFQPIERMAETVRAIQAGHDRRIGELDSRDEVAELAREFDRMLDLLEERNAEIRLAAERLESKVADRTCELTAQNKRLEDTVRLLQETRAQLFSAEKLAALGELTAGVAHEINNPAAVILGNVEVLREELGEALAPVATEVDLIIEQVDRIRAIVDKLLRFARPAASSPATGPSSPRGFAPGFPPGSKPRSGCGPRSPGNRGSSCPTPRARSTPTTPTSGSCSSSTRHPAPSGSSTESGWRRSSSTGSRPPRGKRAAWRRAPTGQAGWGAPAGADAGTAGSLLSGGSDIELGRADLVELERRDLPHEAHAVSTRFGHLEGDFQLARGRFLIGLRESRTGAVGPADDARSGGGIHSDLIPRRHEAVVAPKQDRDARPLDR